MTFSVPESLCSTWLSLLLVKEDNTASILLNVKIDCEEMGGLQNLTE